MYYVSISVWDIKKYDLGLGDHLLYIKLVDKNYQSFPLTLTNNKDWLIDGIKPQLILTEKCNALIHLCNISLDGKWVKRHTKLTSKYNIIKFLLLKQFLEKYFLSDILQNIIDLSD